MVESEGPVAAEMFIRATAFASAGDDSIRAVVRDLAGLLQHLDPLLDEAELVLDGDPEAAARWRELLAWHRADDALRARPIALPAASAIVRPAPVQRLWAATALAARGRRQFETMSQRLFELLGPLAALAALQAAPASGMRTMSAVGLPGLPGTPGGWVPGGRPGQLGPGGPIGDDDFEVTFPKIGEVVWPDRGRLPVGDGIDPIDADSAQEIWESIFAAPSLDPRVPCGVFESMTAMKVRKAAGAYHLTSVSPPDACVGELILIRGTNFKPGRETVVVFPGKVEAAAASVGATEIRVVVPAGAHAGPIRIKTLLDTSRPCDEEFRVYQDGDSLPFAGGGWAINAFTVNGSSEKAFVDGHEALVEWDLPTPAPPGAVVQLQVTYHRGDPVTRTYSWPAQSAKVTMPYNARWATFTLTYPAPVAGTAVKCGPAAVKQIRVWNGTPGVPYVLGTEVTQGIQEHVKVGEPWAAADRSKWNSLELIAGKTTVLRVFPGIRYWPNGKLGGVYVLSAGLRMYDVKTRQQVGQPLVALWADSSGMLHNYVRLPAGGYPYREDTGASFNFIIPFGWATGELDLQVTIKIEDGWGQGETIQVTQRAKWRTKSSLNVHVLRVFGKGGGNAPPLSSQQALLAARTGLDLLPYPVQRLQESPHAPIAVDEWWNERDGNSRLLDEIEEISADYDETHYLGIVNNPLPASGSLVGTAATHETSCWAVQEPVVIAHEMSHCLGLHHIAPWGAEGNPFKDFYLDQLPNDGLIANVPFDIARFKTLNDLAGTNTHYDFMRTMPVVPGVPTVVRPIAVSEYNWTRLAGMNNAW